MAKHPTMAFGTSELIGLAVAGAGLAILPFHLDDYFLHWAITVFMFVVIALAWDLLARSGQSSFGQTAFFGLGAYGSSLLSLTFSFNPVLRFLLASLGVGAGPALCG